MRSVLAVSAGLLCALAGLRQSHVLQQDAIRLHRWMDILKHRALLIDQGLYTLPDALAHAATGQAVPDQVLKALSKGLRESPLSPLSALLARCSIQDLEKPVLQRLMPRLGHGTLCERTQAIHQAIGELELLSSQADERASRDMKLWRTLGLTGGACLTLLLL